MLQTPKLNPQIEESINTFLPDKIKLVIFSQTRYDSVLERLVTCEECNQSIKKQPPPKVCKTCLQPLIDDPNQDRPESEPEDSSEDSEFVDADDFSEGSISKKNTPVRSTPIRNKSIIGMRKQPSVRHTIGLHCSDCYQSLLGKDQKTSICLKCQWPTPRTPLTPLTPGSDTLMNLDNYAQVYANLPSARIECTDFKKYIQKQFRVKDEDIITIQDKDYSSTLNYFRLLESALATDDAGKTLVIYAMAGHGTLMSESQCLLINEFDAQSNFYKRFAGEQKIRKLATQFPNSYHLGIFACSRIEEKDDYKYVRNKAALIEETKLDMIRVSQFESPKEDVVDQVYPATNCMFVFANDEPTNGAYTDLIRQL